MSGLIKLPCITCVCLAICKTRMTHGIDPSLNEGVHTHFNPSAYDSVLRNCYIIEDYITAMEVLQSGFRKVEVMDVEASAKRKFEFIEFMVKDK